MTKSSYRIAAEYLDAARKTPLKNGADLGTKMAIIGLGYALLASIEQAATQESTALDWEQYPELVGDDGPDWTQPGNVPGSEG